MGELKLGVYRRNTSLHNVALVAHVAEKITVHSRLSSRLPSLLHCLDDRGRFDVAKCIALQRQKRQRQSLYLSTEDFPLEDPLPKPKKRRGPKGDWNNDTQQYELVDPTKSYWYKHYVASEECHTIPREAKKFRRRFRMPWSSYRAIIQEARAKSWFPHCEKPDALGKVGAPLDLLVLGSLRYLGRGWTFDDLEEATGISQETHRKFFHAFCKIGATELYDRWVKLPTSPEDISSCMREYAEAGFPNCLGSSDATHVIMERCYARLRNQNKGAKMATTARTFNITVNHRRRILHTTNGFPSSWNDKTLIRFDTFLTDVQLGRTYSEIPFDLTTKTGGVQKYKGAWLMVDNGYIPAWSTTIAPIKYPANVGEMRWSKWLESMRKDVECTFGILKGRFRILKSGIRVVTFEAVNHIWKTCCALHNMLLDVDGLAEGWREGALSEYQGELGEHDTMDIERFAPGHNSSFDISRVGRAFRPSSSSTDREGASSSAVVRPIHQTNVSLFRRHLIDHFDAKWKSGQIRWPSRNGDVQWVPPESYISFLAP